MQKKQFEAISARKGVGYLQCKAPEKAVKTQVKQKDELQK